MNSKGYEKKLYIILNHGIGNIGGGQLYVNSKREFLERLDWTVRIYACQGDNIMVEGLKAHQKYVMDEIKVLPMYLRKSVREKTLCKMAEGVDQFQKIVIESNSVWLSVWGEMLAARIGAKHIVYNLNETPICPPELYEFFKFKLDRLEIAGIKLQSVPFFFKPYLDVKEDEKYHLTAHYVKKQVEDVPCNIVETIKPADFTIGVIGRLAKPYVIKTVQGIIEFATKYPEKKINVIYIGGDDKGGHVEEQLTTAYKDVKNITIYLAGYLYPMPLSLLKILDLVITNAGAAWATSREGILTITIDPNDCMPIGVLGVTTNEVLFRGDEKSCPLPEMLNDILVNCLYSKEQINVPIANNDIMELLQHHMDFVNSSAKTCEYYTDFIIPSLWKKCIISVFGYKAYIKIYKMLKHSNS